MGPILKISSHVKKAQINSADVLADALEKAYKKLKEQIKGHSDLDADIQVCTQSSSLTVDTVDETVLIGPTFTQRSRIPDHLKFLVLGSMP